MPSILDYEKNEIVPGDRIVTIPELGAFKALLDEGTQLEDILPQSSVANQFYATKLSPSEVAIHFGITKTTEWLVEWKRGPLFRKEESRKYFEKLKSSLGNGGNTVDLCSMARKEKDAFLINANDGGSFS